MKYIPGILLLSSLVLHTHAQNQAGTHSVSEAAAGDMPALPKLRVSDDHRHLAFQNGAPFLWLGGTSWGMSEVLTREDIDLYLDDRKSKEFNLVQVCLFWGKRKEDPVSFSLNPPNAYGFRAFDVEPSDGSVNPAQNLGGGAGNPNDYWDHVQYIIQAAYQRGMIVAVLPVWGRRYVNATHEKFSEKYFTIDGMKAYGQFLGGLLKKYTNLVWVMGGDVSADYGGNYLDHYRAMAEGIILGITGEQISWDQDSEFWDYALMTYHPSGDPLKNSSQWFHRDAWLDFNMIETFKSRDLVFAAVQKDYSLNNPVKPTVMGEPAYEGDKPSIPTKGIHIRRQAYQSLFAGAAGFTYGGQRDQLGRGPLWTPYDGWKQLLNMEGAATLKYLKRFGLEHHWPDWIPISDLVIDNRDGELRKVAVHLPGVDQLYVYFPDNSQARIDLSGNYHNVTEFNIQWFNTSTGDYSKIITRSVSHTASTLSINPPDQWQDAVLMISEAK